MDVIVKLREDRRGQATVELAILFPLVLIMSAVVMNTLQFMNACAVEERVFPQLVRVYAASPDYGETAGACAAQVEEALNEALACEGAEAAVSAQADGYGNTVYAVELRYEATLFGLNLRGILFGVELPELRHTSACAVSRYRPGVLA